jgi:hypothetical protein
MKIKIKATPAERKQRRTNRIAAAVVSVNREGTALLFNADEQSQVRLDRISRHMRGQGKTEVRWRMADGTDQIVTVLELEKALAKAIDLQEDLWFI